MYVEKLIYDLTSIPKGSYSTRTYISSPARWCISMIPSGSFCRVVLGGRICFKSRGFWPLFQCCWSLYTHFLILESFLFFLFFMWKNGNARQVSQQCSAHRRRRPQSFLGFNAKTEKNSPSFLASVWGYDNKWNMLTDPFSNLGVTFHSIEKKTNKSVE